MVHNHTFWRTCALVPIFFVGLYNTLINQYTHTEPFTTVIITYTFMCYLIWDICSMLAIPTLYRSELMVHHIVCCLFTMQNVYYNMYERFNMGMICECISLLNYTLRNHRTWLNNYRMLVILLVRLPLFVYDVYVHHSTNIDQLWLCIFLNGSILFIIYDVSLIYRMLKNKCARYLRTVYDTRHVWVTYT